MDSCPHAAKCQTQPRLEPKGLWSDDYDDDFYRRLDGKCLQEIALVSTSFPPATEEREGPRASHRLLMPGHGLGILIYKNQPGHGLGEFFYLYTLDSRAIGCAVQQQLKSHVYCAAAGGINFIKHNVRGYLRAQTLTQTLPQGIWHVGPFVPYLRHNRRALCSLLFSMPA